jgi:type II secretory pathway pseudopilin PulG
LGNGKHGAGTRGGREGWTLLEIVISTVILLTLLVGFSYGLVSSTSLGKTTREQATAREAARGRLEEMRGTAFREILVRFDGDPDNDPDPATGPSPGASFDVPGLTARTDDPDGQVGEVVFPLTEDGELREDLELDRLGMPRDLSGDDIDGLDHALDYRLLPVLVRLQWQGTSGNQAFELLTVLKEMRP